MKVSSLRPTSARVDPPRRGGGNFFTGSRGLRRALTLIVLAWVAAVYGIAFWEMIVRAYP